MLEIIYPTSEMGVTYFYLVWSTAFFVAHMIYEYKTSHPGEFHISNIKHKIHILFSATTFSSSVLLLLSLLNEKLFLILGDITVPIFLAGMSGILLTTPEICPNKSASCEKGGDNNLSEE